MPLAERGNLVLDYMSEEDATQIGKLFVPAFHVYPYVKLCLPDTDAMNVGWTDSTRAAMKDKEHTIALKVTDITTGKIVAHGRWVGPKQEGATEQPGHEDGRWTDNYMEAADPELAEPFFGAFDRNREKFMGDQRHWYMELLFTHPEYQGKGCASMILRHGLELADRDQLPCYIDSSPEGKAVYEYFGWEFDHKEELEYGLVYHFGVRPAQKTSD